MSYYKTYGGDEWCMLHSGLVKLMGEDWDTTLTEDDLKAMLAQAIWERTSKIESPEDEALRLINEGEGSDALQVFRQIHGIVNRFVCCNCGNAKSSTVPCEKCGSWSHTIRAVRIKEESDEYNTDRAKNDREIARMMGGGAHSGIEAIDAALKSTS